MIQMRTYIFLAIVFFGIQNLLFGQVTYNIYYGDNHSHSWYSDGNQDQNKTTYTTPVARSITWAKNNRVSLDFMGISDHNHNESLNMTLAYWRSGVRETDSVNQDGIFVGMYGQEWGTIGGGGHVLVYGTNKLFGWNPGVYDVYVPKSNYALLWDSVKKYNGYCYLAHPNTSDFGSLASAYNAKADSVVRGVAMKSGNAFSTNVSESDPDAGDYTSYFNTLLSKGYHVAPIANQDNHNTTFGKSNQQRTAVVATSLTKTNIDDAFRQRRVYATEDHNLQLRFTANDHQMGEIFSMSGSIPFRVKVTDPDGESISKIELRYGIPGSGSAPTVLTSVLNKDSLIISQAQSTGSTYYYYVYVQEADGNEAWSAPMWITISAGSPPSSFNLLTPTNATTNQAISGILTWQSSTGATSYDVYLGTSNPPTTIVSSNQTGTSYSYAGLSNGTSYYWKVTAKNANGSTNATASPWSFVTVVAPPSAFNLLTPSNNSINQPIAGTLTWQSSINATGYDVYLGTTNPPLTKVSSNQSSTSYSYSGLLNSTSYYWKVVARNTLDTMVATSSPWNFTTIVPLPVAFQLLSPADSVIDQPINGVLTWQTSVNASSYDVYLGTTNPPTTKVSSDQSGTSYNYTNLLNNTTYFWKVTAKNVAGTMDASASPRRFKTIVSVPGAFNQLLPSNASINQSVSGTLTWQASVNASSYDVYMDTNNPPAIRISSDQIGTSCNFNNLLNNTTYFWKIVAKNIAGFTIASTAPWSFTTIISSPSSFSLLVPENLALSQPVAGTLSWQNSANAVAYDVYLDQINPPVTKVSSDQIGTSYNYSGLLNNSNYYWRVVAKNIGGTTLPTDSSRTFTTIISAPNSFSVASPVNNAQNVSTENILTWRRSLNAESYDVYLDTQNPPTTLVGSNLLDTSYQCTNLMNTTTYFWKIIAKNIGGSTEGILSPWTFTTIISQPGDFQLLVPSDLIGDQTLSGDLTWEQSLNASTYDIYLDTVNPPAIKIDSNVSVTTYTYSNLLGGIRYYWNVVAKNIAGAKPASIVAHSFTTIAVPLAAADLNFKTISDAEMEIAWTDKATNETGYRIYRSVNVIGPYLQIGSDLSANSESFIDSDVMPNIRYYYKVVPFNLLGEGSVESISGVTLAQRPGLPTVSNISYSAIKLVLDSTMNPANTEYAIRFIIGNQLYYLRSDGSLESTLQWDDFANWNGSGGLLINNLSACEPYIINVKARNLEITETSWSDSVLGRVTCYSVNRQLNEGWNLVSVPIVSNDMKANTLFPTTVSSAFSFQGGYIPCDTLVEGFGYWIKVIAPTTQVFEGIPVEKDTILFQQGWNLVGSIAENLPIMSLQTEPPDIIASSFYGFEGSYVRVDTLKPAEGYWVKLRESGKIIFTANGVVARPFPKIEISEFQNQGTIRFEDTRGNNQLLSIVSETIPDYKIELANLPPVPPGNAFDVRFKSNRFIETIGNEKEEILPVLIQSSNLPVKISLANHIPDLQFYIYDGKDKKLIDEKNDFTISSQSKSLEIIVKKISTIHDLEVFSLSENYPNPFNPSTQITYQIPKLSRVRIAIFNQLGSEVALLDDGTKNAGTYSLNWVPEVCSGIYYCRMTAVDVKDAANYFIKTNKMLFLK
jgi:hypothetical protein